jgi:hypothetical protein
MVLRDSVPLPKGLLNPTFRPSLRLLCSVTGLALPDRLLGQRLQQRYNFFLDHPRQAFAGAESAGLRS